MRIRKEQIARDFDSICSVFQKGRVLFTAFKEKTTPPSSGLTSRFSQLTTLDFFRSQGDWSVIQPEGFPELPIGKVIIEEGRAIDGEVRRIWELRENVYDPKAQANLDVILTNLIRLKDGRIASTEVDGEVDHTLLSKAFPIIPPMDQINLLNAQVGLGDYESIQNGNNPALKAFSSDTRRLLEMQALENRLKQLNDMSKEGSKLGFGGVNRVFELRTQEAKVRFNQLLEELRSPD